MTEDLIVKDSVAETSVVDNDTSRKRTRERSRSTEQQEHDAVESQPVRKRSNINTPNAKILVTSKYRRGANAVAGIKQTNGLAMIDEKVVGRCDAKFVQSKKVADDFQQRLETCSDGTCGMALEVFNDRGHLKDRHCRDSERKAPGCGKKS